MSFKEEVFLTQATSLRSIGMKRCWERTFSFCRHVLIKISYEVYVLLEVHCVPRKHGVGDQLLFWIDYLVLKCIFLPFSYLRVLELNVIFSNSLKLLGHFLQGKGKSFFPFLVNITCWY